MVFKLLVYFLIIIIFLSIISIIYEYIIESDLYKTLQNLEKIETEINHHKVQFNKVNKKLVLYNKLNIFNEKIPHLKEETKNYSEKISKLERQYDDNMKLYTYLVSENKKEKWWKRMSWLYKKEYLEKL